MTTLALDLGKSIGWMKGNAVGPVEHGTIDLGVEPDLGRFLLAAMMELTPLMRGVHDIAVEQPFLSSGGKKADGTPKPGGYYPARKLLGLLGVVYVCANTNGIPASRVHEVPVPTGKLALAGSGKADKDDMIAAACEWWGFEPDEIDEHQADAGGILKFHHYGPGTPIRKAKSKSGPGRSILRNDERETY